MIYKFLSPNLKYNNGRIYFLNMNELNNDNYKDDNYYLDGNEISVENKIEIENINLKYEVIFSDFDDQIVIKIESENDIDENKIMKYLYFIHEKIKGLELSDFKDFDNEDKYDNKFLGFTKNLV